MKKNLLYAFILFPLIATSQNLVSVTRDVWENNNWQGDWRDSFSYNEQNLQTYHLREDWRINTSSWINQVQTNVTFNDDNLPFLAEQDFWLTATNQWTPSSRLLSTFNQNGDYLVRTFQQLTTGVWTDKLIYRYVYDGDGFLIESTFESWDQNVMTNHDKYSYSNNPDGSADIMIHQRRNIVTDDWAVLDRKLYTYNDSGKVSEINSESWQQTYWYPTTRELLAYDENDFLIYEQGQGYYTDHFEILWQFLHTNDANGNRLETIHQLNSFNPNNSWVNDSRLTYLYQTLSTQTSESPDAFTISPNPAQDFITVNLSKSDSFTAIIISDASGKIVLTETAIMNTPRLEVSHLESGIYFVKVIQEGKSSVKKIVKK